MIMYSSIPIPRSPEESHSKSGSKPGAILEYFSKALLPIGQYTIICAVALTTAL